MAPVMLTNTPFWKPSNTDMNSPRLLPKWCCRAPRVMPACLQICPSLTSEYGWREKISRPLARMWCRIDSTLRSRRAIGAPLLTGTHQTNNHGECQILRDRKFSSHARVTGTTTKTAEGLSASKVVAGQSTSEHHSSGTLVRER